MGFVERDRSCDSKVGGLELLAPNEVHVWVIKPPSIIEPAVLHWFDELMTADERKKQRAFVFDKNRHESLVTRGLVRTSLSRYRSKPPSEWRFLSNEYGRPEIDPPCGLRFNLSNHPEMVVCAVCEHADLGVDVEPIHRGPEILEVADSVFAPEELSELRHLPFDARLDRAVSLWTLKESYIKARGMGLSLPLDGFAMRFPSNGPPCVTFAATIEDDPFRWAFRTMNVDGFRIALAVDAHGADPVVRLRRWLGR